jgi:lysozyme family protein
MNFDQAFELLLGHEGKYSNRAEDRGKETMWGITIAVARENGYEGEMKDLPQDFARKVYQAKYWDTAKVYYLPAEMRFDVFDGAVNSGVEQSIKWLQLSLGVTPDGDFGPKTLAAVRQFDGQKLRRKYNGHRLQFMATLSSWPAFGRGWANRIAKNLLRD